MGSGLRGFRFRLAVSYVSSFTLLLAFLGIVFRRKPSTTGRSVDNNKRAVRHFSWNYIGLLPVMIVAAGLLAWFFAGRVEQT
jgi:hypothetical protein